jgi:DNA-directed RNA polymerase omega subunit
MISKPNVNELVKKTGNRYEAVIAIAKRARDIGQKRLERGDSNIKDAVDLAAVEIYEEKALVKKDGEYVLKNRDNEIDMDTVISNTVDVILKDLAAKDEIMDINEPKKAKKAKKNIVEKKVTEIVDETKTKATKKMVKKDSKDE